MISIKNLFKSFGKNEVLKGIELKTRPGEILAVLGPNGSGKTTLIKSVLGLVLPDEGEILVNENSIKGDNTYRNQIAYLPQLAQFPENLKTRELFSMIKDIREQNSREDHLIKRFALESYLDKPLRNLSGGTRQKVNIVLAMMFDTPILILDEPTVGLDPIALIELKNLIVEEKNRGKTILLTTHITHLVEELADRIVFILEGTICFDGTPKVLIKNHKSKNLEQAIASVLLNEKPVLNEERKKHSLC